MMYIDTKDGLILTIIETQGDEVRYRWSHWPIGDSVTEPFHRLEWHLIHTWKAKRVGFTHYIDLLK